MYTHQAKETEITEMYKKFIERVAAVMLCITTSANTMVLVVLENHEVLLLIDVTLGV